MSGESDKKAKRKEYAQELGQRIAMAAEEAEGKKALGKKAGLTEDQVHKYVRGENIPSVDKLVAIANATGKSIEWLATGRAQPVAPAGPVVSAVDGVKCLNSYTYGYSCYAVRRGLSIAQKSMDWLANEVDNEIHVVKDFLEARFIYREDCDCDGYALALINAEYLPIEVSYALTRSTEERPLKYLRLPKIHPEMDGAIWAAESIAFEEGWLQILVSQLPKNDVKNLKLIEMPDDSMWPTLKIGDLLLFYQDGSGFTITGIYVIEVDGTIRVRTISRRPSGNFLLTKEIKQFFEQQEFTQEEFKKVKILGRVIWAGTAF